MQQIPVMDANDSLTEVDLDGVTYFLHLAWNSESEAWSLGIENVNQAVLVEGVAVVPNYPLLRATRTAGYPPGDLLAIRSDRGNRISRDDLPLGLVPLIYVPQAELP